MLGALGALNRRPLCMLRRQAHWAVFVNVLLLGSQSVWRCDCNSPVIPVWHGPETSVAAPRCLAKHGPTQTERINSTLAGVLSCGACADAAGDPPRGPPARAPSSKRQTRLFIGTLAVLRQRCC